MNKRQRAQRILEILEERQYCRIEELRDLLATSTATIHRDINELASRNLIKKSYGGIELPPPSTSFEDSVNVRHMLRLGKNRMGKEAIAEIALTLVQDDDVIFVDSSTTVYYFVKKLIEQHASFSNLTLVTNSCAIIRELSTPPPSFSIISLGGVYNTRLNSFLGQIAVNAIKQLRVSKAFISAAAVSPSQTFTFHENHAQFLKEVIAHADRSYLLVDHLKFETRATFSIGPTSQFTTVITDPRLTDDTVSKYLTSGVNLNL